MTLHNIRFGDTPDAPETSPEVLAAGRAYLAAEAAYDAAADAWWADGESGRLGRKLDYAAEDYRAARRYLTEILLADSRAGDRGIVIETNPTRETE